VNDTVLTSAVKRGNFELVKCLLEHGADFSYYRNYPLRIAVEQGYLQIANCLLESGADPRCVFYEDQIRKSPKSGREEMIKLLLSYDFEDEDGFLELTSLLLRMRLVKMRRNYAFRSKLLTSYRRIIYVELTLFLYHLYYRPCSPAFFQAVNQEN